MPASLLRLLLLATIPLAVWCLWPRPSSLLPLHPPTAARLAIDARQAAADHRTAAELAALYQLHALQHRLPPIPAARASWHLHRARRLHLDAPDHPAQERALPSLVEFHTILRDATSATFDPAVTARIHLSTWMLAGDPSKTRQLRTATAELLALLHGGNAATRTAPATHLAASLRHSATRQWPQAVEQETLGLGALAKP